MLFAQIKAPPPPPAPPAAEVRSADPRTTAPTPPAGVDPATGLPLRDPNDQRTTRDTDYDPRAPQQQPAPRDRNQYDPAFGAVPTARGAARAAEEEGTPFRPGGLDYGAQIALVEGYNDNVVQTQDVINGPVKRHPSPFTGVDLELNLRTWTSPFDPHEFRLDLRGQHYTPLDGYDEPDDGAVVLSYTGQITLGKRDVLVNRAISTVATLNSSRLSDGPLFLVEPGSLQRTYTMTTLRSSLMHEISPRWRYQQAVDLVVGTTIHDAPVSDGVNDIYHHGLDFIQPGTDGELFYDLNDQDVADLRVRYEANRNYFLLDYTQVPPRLAGEATTHVGEATLGLSHAFSDSLRWITQAGATLATAPPLDPDTRPILSPLVVSELLLTKQYWLFESNVAYAYGATSPRLGFGPTASASASLQGYPFPHTYVLRNLAVLASATANRSAFRTTDQLSRLSFVIADVEGRYAVNRWLGLVFGYTYRYANFEGAGALPDLTRNVFFVGVSGYWNTDRTLPLITTFQAPISSG